MSLRQSYVIFKEKGEKQTLSTERLDPKDEKVENGVFIESP